MTAEWENMGTDSLYSGHRFYTHRLKVPGGWLYRVIADDYHTFTTTFVPEPPSHVGAGAHGHGMGSTEALNLLEQGKRVRRRTSFAEGAHLFQDADGSIIIHCMDGRMVPYALTIQDCIALDWELVP